MLKNRQRILLIGNSGSGKSTLAEKLGKSLNLPVHHLDLHFWGPGWEHPCDDVWREKLIGFLNQDQWVIEGGVNNLELRLEAADLIIFLDFPTWTCFWRCIKRYIRFFDPQKTFLQKGCKNKLDWKFLYYIFTFEKTRAGRIREALKEYSDKVVILKTPEDVEVFEKQI